jgi:alpha-L-fucosidase
MLIDVVSKGGNLLLNVGPTPEGKIQEVERQVLEAIGDWLEVNGDAIYGTTASPFNKLPFFGRVTTKGNTLYVHLFLCPEDGRVVLPNLHNEVRAVRRLGSDAECKVERVGDEVVLQMGKATAGPIATVFKLELDGPPRVDPYVIAQGDDGIVELPALLADIRGRHGQRARFDVTDRRVHIGNWTKKTDRVTWEFTVEKDGNYDVTAVYSANEASSVCTFEVAAERVPNETDKKVSEIPGGEAFELSESASRFHSVVKAGQPARRTIGQVRLVNGRNILVITPLHLPKDIELMKLYGVELKPAGEK